MDSVLGAVVGVAGGHGNSCVSGSPYFDPMDFAEHVAGNGGIATHQSIQTDADELGSCDVAFQTIAILLGARVPNGWRAVAKGLTDGREVKFDGL